MEKQQQKGLEGLWFLYSLCLCWAVQWQGLNFIGTFGYETKEGGEGERRVSCMG